MAVARYDISLLSQARRSCAFPLRLIRGMFWFLMFIAILVVVMIATIVFRGEVLAVLRTEPQSLAILGLLLIAPIVPYRMARGGPIAFFLVVSFVWLIVLAELFDTATTLVFGFPAFDLSTLNTNYSQGAAIQDVLNGLLDDARFLPFRLYTLFLLFVAMRLLWPLVKLHALPSFKPIRRFKRYVFLAPRELRSLLYIFRNHVFWNPGIPVASFRALGAYCLYAIFLFNALYVAFYISDSRWQAVIVKILWQKLELRTTSSLVGGQLAVIALCLALFLVSLLISVISCAARSA